MERIVVEVTSTDAVTKKSFMGTWVKGPDEPHDTCNGSVTVALTQRGQIAV